MTRANGQPGMVVLVPPHNKPAEEVKAIDYVVEVEIGMMRGMMRKNSFHGGLMKGLALAHPQVSDAPLAIFVVGGRLSEKVVINPVILDRAEPLKNRMEGCLSFPRSRPTKVVCQRFRTITVSYRDERFQEHQETLTGEMAQIFQHEIEHLKGKNIYGWRANQG